MRITEEIFQVGGGNLSSPEDAAVYLVHYAGEAALVDAGCGQSMERIIANIREQGVEPESIRYLLLTHCHFDHTGGALALREELPCQTVAHRLDAPYLESGDNGVTAADWYGAQVEPCPIDYKIFGAQDRLLLGGRVIQAIHVPGHSPGSVVYLTESQGLKVLFGQDVHGPLHSSLLSNREDYLRSLDLLLSLEADILCEGHFGVIEGRRKVAGFIEQYRAVHS